MPNPTNSYLAMVPQFGVLAVILAVATTVFSGKQASALAKTAVEEKVEDGKPQVPPPKQDQSESCQSKLVEFGILKPETWLLPVSLRTETNLEFLIVAVPDPLETQFGSRFDQTNA